MEISRRLLLALVLSSSCSMSPTVAASSFNLLTWGDKCQKEVTSVTSGECDQSVGLNCYTYSQGDYCGCHPTGPSSWDEKSKQCRRKPFASCSYDPPAEAVTPFQFLCHVDASCLPANNTVVKSSHPPRQCFCNEGFKPFGAAGGQPWKCVSTAGGAWIKGSAGVAGVLSVLALIVSSRCSA